MVTRNLNKVRSLCTLRYTCCALHDWLLRSLSAALLPRGPPHSAYDTDLRFPGRAPAASTCALHPSTPLHSPACPPRPPSSDHRRQLLPGRARGALQQAPPPHRPGRAGAQHRMQHITACLMLRGELLPAHAGIRGPERRACCTRRALAFRAAGAAPWLLMTHFMARS